MNDDPKISPSDSGDLAALRALPPHDVDAAHAARLGARGLAAFESAHGNVSHGAFVASFARAWSRFGVPVMLAGVVFVYLGWTVQATSALYR